ncbi:type 4a pilus biogenesis protein PilO [Candidatus Saccharibacteria bacterium]|nr:MAG: type 4a pilus biogenesis protein PilO [Candidatus Saccharibacteria bacterium]
MKELKKSYEAFNNTAINILEGNPAGTGQKDGNNAKIVLDALPSTYDFPALATSLEALVVSQNLKINSITGTDDEVIQAQNRTSTNPQPISIPFDLSVSSNYDGVKNVIGAFEKSIRPIQLKTLDISGDKDELTLVIGAQTYFQPAKSLNISTKVVQ